MSSDKASIMTYRQLYSSARSDIRDLYIDNVELIDNSPQLSVYKPIGMLMGMMFLNRVTNLVFNNTQEEVISNGR